VIDYVCRLLAHLDQHDLRTAVPVPDPALQRRPLMLLSSGYIQRSAHLLPSEGDRAPWRLEQNYLIDRKVINRARIDDGVLRFT
jgi:cyclohexanone monooxygenase